jgi:hypothetical protein
MGHQVSHSTSKQNFPLPLRLSITHKSVGGRFFVSKSDAHVAIGAEPTPCPRPWAGERIFFAVFGAFRPKNSMIPLPFPCFGERSSAHRKR